MEGGYVTLCYYILILTSSFHGLLIQYCSIHYKHLSAFFTLSIHHTARFTHWTNTIDHKTMYNSWCIYNEYDDVRGVAGENNCVKLNKTLVNVSPSLSIRWSTAVFNLCVCVLRGIPPPILLTGNKWYVHWTGIKRLKITTSWDFFFYEIIGGQKM